MRSRLFILTCFLFFAGRAVAEPTALDRLVACMSGAFTTADQARGDQNFHDLALHATPVWTDRTDGPWLYVEQALSSAIDHPYRQHIYQLTARADGALECHIFELPDPIAVTGAWKNPSLLAKLSPAGLSASESCTVILHVQPDGSFQGGTQGKDCLSTLRGASYTTTEDTISDKQMITWERGYNANGTQVWGSTRGGYVFKKVE